MYFKDLNQNKFHIHSGKWNTTEPHGHSFLEFAYIKSGSVEHSINGELMTVNAGEYYIIDHGSIHSYNRMTRDDVYVDNFLFYPEFLDRTLAGKKLFGDVLGSYILKFSYKTLKEPITGKTFRDEDGRIYALVQEIINEYNKRDYGYLECIRCMFVKILIYTMRKVGHNESVLTMSELMTEVTDYVKNNYSSTLHISDIAKKFNYSESYLSVQFSKYTHKGFREYLQQVRMEQACRLLEQTDLRISEIANKVGYNDIKSFNVIFKKLVGHTPRNFRRFLK